MANYILIEHDVAYGFATWYFNTLEEAQAYMAERFDRECAFNCISQEDEDRCGIDSFSAWVDDCEWIIDQVPHFS